MPTRSITAMNAVIVHPQRLKCSPTLLSERGAGGIFTVMTVMDGLTGVAWSCGSRCLARSRGKKRGAECRNIGHGPETYSKFPRNCKSSEEKRFTKSDGKLTVRLEQCSEHWKR